MTGYTEVASERMQLPFFLITLRESGILYGKETMKMMAV
jgi:hypothetical protein